MQNGYMTVVEKYSLVRHFLLVRLTLSCLEFNFKVLICVQYVKNVDAICKKGIYFF